MFTVKALSCDVDLKQYIIKALSSVSSHFRNVIMWVTCEQHKNPLLEGVGPVPMGVLRVLNNKNSSGLELQR